LDVSRYAFTQSDTLDFILSKPQRFDGDHQAFEKEDDWEVEDDYGTWRLSMPGSL